MLESTAAEADNVSSKLRCVNESQADVIAARRPDGGVTANGRRVPDGILRAGIGQRGIFAARAVRIILSGGGRRRQRLAGMGTGARSGPKTFVPYTFMTVPTEEHVALYQRGIERAVKADLYAGLLVAAHCVGLYDRAKATMPGYSAKYVKAQEQHHANDFVQRLRLQQLRLKVDLRNNLATKPFTEEKLIKTNTQRLDALDRAIIN